MRTTNPKIDRVGYESRRSSTVTVICGAPVDRPHTDSTKLRSSVDTPHSTAARKACSTAPEALRVAVL
jgi:hypothetical protein